MRLAEALDETPNATLRRIAEAHGLAHDDATTRAELISRIADRFSDATYLDEQFRDLPEGEQVVLLSARASGGELRGFLVDSEHPGAAESLADRGWLYRVFTAAGPLRGEVFVVPDELVAVLSPPSQGAPPLGSAEPPDERRSTDPAFSIFALISALTRPGGDLEQEVRSWSEEPGAWHWDARWNLLQRLATAAGMLVHRGDGTLAPSPALPRQLGNPSSVGPRLWRAYLRESNWSELALSGVVDSDNVLDLVDVAALRHTVVDAVERLAENAWTTLDAFSDWLRIEHPTIVREQLTPRGLLLLQGQGWANLERPLLRAFVLGPLYWLGRVALSRDGESFCRRGASATDERGFEPCGWSESGAELLAPARAHLGALLEAEKYLVLRERGRVSRYHLLQAHVAAALATGGSIPECRDLLSMLTEGPLPSQVNERLAAWDERFGALEIRPTVVLEARSASDLDATLADERVRAFIRGPLGPQTVEVAAADAFELAAALREAGHLPRVDAALRLAAEPRRAYAGMVDEQVLEFLLVSLLAFRAAWPERLAELEGSQALLERLEHQFPPERLAQLRADAARLAGSLASAPRPARPRRPGGRSPRVTRRSQASRGQRPTL